MFGEEGYVAEPGNAEDELPRLGFCLVREVQGHPQERVRVEGVEPPNSNQTVEIADGIDTATLAYKSVSSTHQLHSLDLLQLNSNTRHIQN